MGRPKKEFKIKRNGDSIQVFWSGEYVGSISLEKLCLFIIEEKRKGTERVSAQPHFIRTG